MDLNFEIGDSTMPRGHTFVYFTEPISTEIFASYIVLLPITVDVSKYVPPFLMNQVGDMVPGDMSAFAFPPSPEPVSNKIFLENLCEYRNDDLIYGGIYNHNDITSLIMKVNDISQDYLKLYESKISQLLPNVTDDGQLNEISSLNEVLYSLMNESDRLTELTKLVGKLRFTIERSEIEIMEEAERDLNSLCNHFPDSFKITELLEWARKPDDKSGKIADLYLQRCFHLNREEYKQLGNVEDQINSLT
jgi:hypothetical protein